MPGGHRSHLRPEPSGDVVWPKPKYGSFSAGEVQACEKNALSRIGLCARLFSELIGSKRHGLASELRLLMDPEARVPRCIEMLLLRDGYI